MTRIMSPWQQLSAVSSHPAIRTLAGLHSALFCCAQCCALQVLLVLCLMRGQVKVSCWQGKFAVSASVKYHLWWLGTMCNGKCGVLCHGAPGLWGYQEQ